MRVAEARKTNAPLTLHAETAANLMAPNPISLCAEAAVADAIVLFADKGIAAAPVIDEAGRPIGVVSRSDLIVHQCEHGRHGAGQPDYFFAPSFEGQETPRETRADAAVADLMTPAVFAVSPDTPVHRVLNDMLGLHVHRLFVVDDDGVLIGVITTMDVLKCLRED